MRPSPGFNLSPPSFPWLDPYPARTTVQFHIVAMEPSTSQQQAIARHGAYQLCEVRLVGALDYNVGPTEMRFL